MEDLPIITVSGVYCLFWRALWLFQLLQLVLDGDLPCSKEEAACLAGIQLRIEESWGRRFPGGTSSTTQNLPAPVSPDDPSTLRPISEDKVSLGTYYSINQRRRKAFEKPIISQLSEETRRFIIQFTRLRHRSYTWVRWYQSSFSPSVSFITFLILSSHLCLGFFLICLFP